MKGLLKMKLKETKRFHGVVKLNNTGSEIVHLLENNDMSLEDLFEHFYKSCPNDDKEVIKQGVSEFIKKLYEINAIVE